MKILTPRRTGYLALVGLMIFAVGCSKPQRLPDEISFNKHIRPVLSDNCFKCHGPDKEAIEADLRLDVEEDAKKERDGYQVIVEGRPGQSEMIRRIKLDPSHEDYMPHEDANKSLSSYEIALLEQWVADGARWEDHWAYIPPKKLTPPSNRRTREYDHPIDRFIVASLQESKHVLSPRADSITLLRRLYFDMIGLPPSYEQVTLFLEDTRPDAYEQVVQQLLASPHYGERMAIGWLDIVRYADTNGFHSDVHRHIYPYRDYVIQGL